MATLPRKIIMVLRNYFTLFLYISFSLTASVSQADNTVCPRIISQSPYITDMLTYMEMDHCIVGVSRYSKRNLPHTGGILDPDAEAIDALMPDLFITSDWAKPETVKAVTPKDATAIQLKSFRKMVQLEQNMETIIKATGWTQARPKVNNFKTAWRKKAKLVKGNNKKVLLLSSCSGLPYSFGPNSRLYDLFTQAGFRVVETGEKIRHIRPGNEIEHVTALLDRYQPDLLFIFEQRLKRECQMLTPKVPVSILSFDGELFLQPNTEILKGLDLLINMKHRWN